MKKKVFASLLAASLVLSAAAPVSAAEPEARADGQDMVYGTLNLSYADFYYGELNDTAAGEETIPDLEADLAAEAGYKETGMYDAVTSATTSKSKRFDATYFEEIQENGAAKVKIYGLKDVQVAIPKALYDNILAEKEKGTACANDLYDYVEDMTVSEEAFTEYKVLNADGTFSKMVTEIVVDEDAAATVQTGTAWGNYQLSMENLDVTNADLANIMGAVVETEDGARYGLKHLDNLWLQPQEIAFAVEPDFVEPHGNTIEWKRFEDMQGKTIKTVTYLMKNAPDVVVNVNEKCKRLLSEQQGGTAIQSLYQSGGTSLALMLQVPQAANYQITSITGNTNGVLSTDSYRYSGSVLTLSGDCHPGKYTVAFQDDEYEDFQVEAVVASTISEDGLKIVNNRLSVQDSVTSYQEYLSEVTGVVVNGKEITANGLGSLIFGEEGIIDFEAKTTGRGATEIFPEGSEGDYELTVKASGFPEITANVGKSYKEKTDQSIQVVQSVTKTYGDAAFSLQALAEGALTYVSSNAGVASVAADGKVTITGAGQAVITICAAETGDKKAAEANVAITVQKAQAKVTGTTSYKKTYGNKKFALNAASNGGALSYQTSDKNVVAVSANGTVAIKGAGKAVITVTTAETANYKSGSMSVSLTVSPKKAVLKGAKSNKKKTAVITWKKSAGVTGYEIRLSTNKKFTKGQKTVTVKSAKTVKNTVGKLKSGKTYFVKIRAYKMADGAKIYGAYSVSQSVKVK